MDKIDYIVGIDEAGRGPLAGPVCVGAVLAPADFDFSVFENLTDSKQLTENGREKIFEQLTQTSKVRFVVAATQARTIDKIGINKAIARALGRTLRKLVPTSAKNARSKVFLDGGLTAPRRFSNQETIIKGDQKIPSISLASVAAKVSRDHHMKRQSAFFPNFAFKKHKGYGTALHRQALKTHGPTEIHRKSFITKII